MTPEERALLADLKMYDQADKTRVREHEFKRIDEKRTPEIGPVDENLKLEEPDYEIPWSGKIDENKKVLGNAIDLAKISMGDFSDSYLPDEIPNIQTMADIASLIDPSMLGEKKALAALGLFATPMAEHKWAKKYFQKPEAVANYERLTDTAREKMSKAIVEAEENGMKTRRIKPSTKELGHINGGKASSQNWTETRLPNIDHPNYEWTAMHEPLHGTERMSRSFDPQYYQATMDNSDLVKTAQQRLNDLFNKQGSVSPSEFTKIINEVIDEGQYGDVLRGAKTNGDLSRQFVEAELSDYVGGKKAPDGEMWNDKFQTWHDKGYNKTHNLWHNWDAATGEGMAYHTESMASPFAGRYLMANGLGNENTYFGAMNMADEAVYDNARAKLNKLTKKEMAEGDVGLLGPKENPKVKLGGSKYKKFIEQNADKVDPRSLLLNWSGTPNNKELLAAANDAGVGDRYAVKLFDVGDDGTKIPRPGGTELAQFIVDDALTQRMPERNKVSKAMRALNDEKRVHSRGAADIREGTNEYGISAQDYPYAGHPTQVYQDYKDEVERLNQRRANWGEDTLSNEAKRAVMEQIVKQRSNQQHDFGNAVGRQKGYRSDWKGQAARDSLDRVIGHTFGKHLTK